ncbi:MAG: mandelate racemase/muconate lactonizing enzyme family protein, partial [Solirubrobacteraceae bacterium]
LHLYVRALTDIGDGTREDALAACAAAAPLAQALAAIDLALWDMAGQRAEKPVWALLGAQKAPSVQCNATIGAEEPARAAAEASVAVAAGFRCVKVKVGDPRSRERVDAVRAAIGPEVALRLDANGAWSGEDAVQRLAALAEARPELCEEPVHGVAALAQVARASPRVRLAADESCADPSLLSSRICHSVCLKISRAGGITGLLGQAAMARRAGYEVYLASTLDGPLGIAAALHAAAAIDPDRPCGLATLERFAPPAPLAPRGGTLTPPVGAGLGSGLAGWYEGL